MSPSDERASFERWPGLLRWLGRLQRLQLRIAVAALLVMMVVTVADVILRYAFNSPIRGSYELVEALLVVFVFHGMTSAFLTRKNIVIDVIDSFVPARTTRRLIRGSDILSVLTLVLIGWAMTRTALQAYDYGDRKLELQLPVYVLWIAALFGLAGTMLCALGTFVLPPTASDEPPAA